MSLHKTPFWENLGNFSLYSLNFCPNLSSQAPKFWSFQLTSPQNLEIFSSQAHSFRVKYQFASPTLRKSGLHTPTWKKSWVPPTPGAWILLKNIFIKLKLVRNNCINMHICPLMALKPMPNRMLWLLDFIYLFVCLFVFSFVLCIETVDAFCVMLMFVCSFFNFIFLSCVWKKNKRQNLCLGRVLWKIKKHAQCLKIFPSFLLALAFKCGIMFEYGL